MWMVLDGFGVGVVVGVNEELVMCVWIKFFNLFRGNGVKFVFYVVVGLYWNGVFVLECCGC